MSAQLVLWGPPIVPSNLGHPDYARDVEAWVRKAASVGVTKMVPWGPAVVPSDLGDLSDDRRVAGDALPQAAHKNGIVVHPYLGYTAFPTYGVRTKSWIWSLDFLNVPTDSPAATQIIDSHRPIFDGPVIGDEGLEPFAAAHPEFWSLTRDKRMSLEPGEKRCLSLAFPEVRANQIRKFLDILDALPSCDGMQLEFITGNVDENGVATYGYEDAVVEAFIDEHGRSPFDLPNGDPEWLAFRAGYVTSFLRELRDAIKARRPEAQFTTTMVAGDPDDYAKVLQDWPEWVEQGIVDELYIWWRTDSDPRSVERQARHVADVVGGRCPFIAEMSCYHPGSFQNPDRMLEGARMALANGADAVGVYRTHGVEQLGFWPVLEQMAKL